MKFSIKNRIIIKNIKFFESEEILNRIKKKLLKMNNKIIAMIPKIVINYY